MRFLTWFRDVVQLGVGFALLALIVYGAFYLVKLAIQSIALLNPSITVAIIAAGATVVVSVISIVLGKLYEYSEQVKKEHREKAIPVYENLIRFMSRVLMVTRSGEAVSENEMIDFIGKFTQDMMVWGSDDVISAWIKWRRTTVNQGQLAANPATAQYEALVYAIRRELGHKNKGLVKDDILSMFVNDIDHHLPRGAR